MRVPSWSIPVAQWLRNHQLLYARWVRIYGALVAAGKQWAEARGLSRLYTTIARDNEASERAHRAAGFRTVAGSVTVLRLGNHEWKRVSRPKGTQVVDLLE